MASTLLTRGVVADQTKVTWLTACPLAMEDMVLLASRSRGTKIYGGRGRGNCIIKHEQRFTSYVQERDALLCLNQSPHKYLPRLYGYNDQEQWLVIEKRHGRHLNTFYNVNLVSRSQRLGIALSLLDIFDHIHSCGIAHFDTHYENILYDPRREMLSLIDFGSCGMGSNVSRVKLGKLRSRYCESKKRFYRAPELTKNMIVDGSLAERYGIASLLYSLVWGLGPLNECYPLHSDRVERQKLQTITQKLPHYRESQGALLQAILTNFEPDNPDLRLYDTATLKPLIIEALT